MNFQLQVYIFFPCGYNFDLLIKSENIQRFFTFSYELLPTMIFLFPIMSWWHAISMYFFLFTLKPYRHLITHLHFFLLFFGGTYTKIGTIQRRLAWPLCKDDMQNCEAFHIFHFIYFYHDLSTPAMYTDSSHVDVALSPSC